MYENSTVKPIMQSQRLLIKQMNILGLDMQFDHRPAAFYTGGSGFDL